MAKGQAIVRLTAETNDYESKIRQANKTFDGFMKGIGLSPAKFGTLAVAIGGTTAALKVAKDAFFNSEKNLDEWGRTVESSKSIYKGFLNAINTGDIRGFLSNMDTIVKAARDAYDALDELATYNAFNRVNIAKARAGLTDAIADYREGTGSKEAVSENSQRVIQELETKREKQLSAYVQSIRKVAAERGVNPAMLLKVMTGSYGSFQDLKNTKFSGRRTVFYGGGQFGGGGSYEEAFPVGTREKLAQAVQNLNDTEIDTLQAMGEAAEMTKIEINNQRKSVARILNGRSGGGGGGGRGGRGGSGGGGNTGNVIDYASDSIEAQEKLVQDLTEKWKKASAELRDGYNQQLTAAKNQLEVMQNPIRKMSEYESQLQSATMAGAGGGGNFSDKSFMNVGPLNVVGTFQILTQELQTLRDLQESALTTDEWENYGRAIEATEKKLKVFTGDVGNVYSEMSKAANAIQAVGGALQGIEDPAAKVMGIIAEAIATIALTFAKSLEGTFTPWDWIAGAATGVATMVSTIAAIKSATAGSFAHGGVIGGHSYSGDNQFAMVNAGETILTQAQAGILSSRINGLASQDYVLDAVIDGEKIRLVMNRNSRRRMHGEYVTTKGH